MIARYTTPFMRTLWSDDTKFAKWLVIEIAVLEGWVKTGAVKKSVLARVKKKARFTVKRIELIEKKVKHDVIAFLTNVAEHVGKDARFIHMGMTSSDVLDTAFALLLIDAGKKLLEDLKLLKSILKTRHPQCKVFAKVESKTALKNLEGIIEESDGIIIARGDLGICIPIY
ncbi:MAG: hypothetical protein E3J78_08225, partial [Candidatus Cloacimonadota bacterium]